MIAEIIIGLILFIIIGVVLFIYGFQEKLFIDQLFGVLIVIASTLVLTAICIYYTERDEPTPQAIDVYRGKTTLEITYRDSIPVDSVVVFKEN